MYMFALDMGIILFEVHYFIIMEARNQVLTIFCVVVAALSYCQTLPSPSLH